MLTPVNLPDKAESYVLAAAQRVLIKSGPDAVTMRTVAEEAGVTATALYRHYADKSTLLRALVRSVHSQFKAQLPIHDAASDPARELERGWRAYFDFGIEHPQFYRLLFVAPHGIAIDRFPDDFRRGKSSTFRELSRSVQACVDDGSILHNGPVHEIALSMFAHMHGLVMLHLAGRFSGDHATFRSFALRAMRRSFFSAKSRRADPLARTNSGE
jgi:AcrR family transcriptional regulator